MKFTLSQEDVAGLNDEQKNAVFEALVTAVFADGKVDPKEIERFEHEIGLAPLGQDKETLAKMTAAARAKVTQLKNAEEVMTFIKDIASRVTSQELREKVLRMMGSIMFADRDVNQEEKNVLGAFALHFGIPKERIEAIKNEVKGG